MTPPRAIRSFHVAGTARDRYAIGGALFASNGDLITANVAEVRRLAARMNAARAADLAPGTPTVQAGELHALGLIHEVFHVLVERYETEARPGAMEAAIAALRGALGDRRADSLLGAFRDTFPPPDPGAPPPRPGDVLEELLLTWVANRNPAAATLRELFDDSPLEASPDYPAAVRGLQSFFDREPRFGPDAQTLIALLRAPALASPTSLTGQLRFIRERWGSLLGDLIDRLLVAIDVIAEEERALHLRFGGGAQGGFGGEVHTPEFAGLDAEPERFSWDSEWMPRIVLLAKSTYVWLDQLSRRHRRDIRTLDAIPDEELDTLARWGITGLWLIGLWQRSQASERIKRLRGNPDAVASAYSLDDYRIADDLGGEDAFMRLRDRAWARGIRIASDMVPNHMGIDSRWVVEHPEWFISLPEAPYPSYSFNGPDLSSDERVGIFLEDHYYDSSDAAVVFRRLDRWTGENRYVYHGNDGTSFPWNDTAQLDYLNPEVREAVIRTILDVARRSPVIRFDAAMVLAKKHIQRLWYPEPGAGGAIPSRAEHAIPKAAFDAAMPVEFWREVVDRVATEVPDTLLLAEAFWLLEGYFVRTLGMHRVYNSAFMHMLRDEDNAGYRRVMKETLEFDPEILKRYVNFMNNPDEKTALEQFGKGDKYFGVAALLATLPGLPMIGHGQVEGFGEKYGMEYRRATLDEQPDPWLVERHEREIFPLLHRRGLFAGAEDFLLYDFVTGDGAVDENVFAYSNGRGPGRSLVVYHNRYASTGGFVRDSVAFAVKQADGSKQLVRRTLAEGLAMAGDPDTFLAFRDARTGLQYLRSVDELREQGLFVRLDAYQGHVFWEFREIHDPAGIWRRLAGRLGGAGVPSLDDALREQELEPVHRPLRAIYGARLLERLFEAVDPSGRPTPETADEARALDELGRLAESVFQAMADATGTPGDPAGVAAVARDLVAASVAASALGPSLSSVLATQPARATLFTWALLSPAGRLAPGADRAATSRAWFDELRLAPVVAAGLREAGLDEGGAWGVVERVRVLLALPRPSSLGRPATTLPRRLVETWIAHPDVRPFIRVNRWEGVEYFGKEGWEELLDWTLVLDSIDGADAAATAKLVARLRATGEAAGYRVDRLREAVTPPSRPKPRTAASRRATPPAV